MFNAQRLCALASLTFVMASPVSAQDIVTAQPIVVEAPVAKRIMPAATQVNLTPMDEISSKKVEVGDHFRFQIIADVIEQGVVVIPRGSIAQGTISWKTGRAIGGKSGKFEIQFDHVMVGTRQILLNGTHRQEGKGNTVGAVFGSLWISGRSAVMLPGQTVTALTKEPIEY